MSMNVTASTYTYSTVKADQGTSETQDLAQQIQQALQTGDTQALQTLAQSAGSLLDDLDKAQTELTGSLATPNLTPSAASQLYTQLSGVESSASQLQAAMSAMDQALGQAYETGTPSAPFTPSTGFSTASALPTTSNESSGSSAFNFASTSSGGSSRTFDQIMQALQDPAKAAELKAYVKSQGGDLMDAVLRAIEGSSGGGGNSSSSSSKGSKKGAANTATNGGAVQTGNGVNTGNSQAANTTGGAAGASGSGLTFSSNSALGGFTDSSTTQIGTVSSGLSLTSGGAQSGNGNSASVDAWDSKLGLSNPGNIDEFLMMVLLASYEDGQKGLEDMAKELQKTNDQKKGLRSQLAGLYNQKTGNENADTAVDAKIQNVQGQLSSASDDAQLQQLQLQNATQNQQQLLQEISSFSKNLYDASMNILRKIGG